MTPGWTTIRELVAHFSRKHRLILLPLLFVLLLAALLLFATSGLAYVSPFFYGIF